VLLDHRDRRTDLPRRAVTALEAVQVEERLLHRMQLFALGHTLDGRDLTPLGRHRQLQAGDGPASVQQHGAGTALPLVAALLGAGQIQALAQGVEQGGAVVDGQCALLAVDVQGDDAVRRRGAWGHHQPSFGCTSTPR
jgi:hypothetical protein